MPSSVFSTFFRVFTRLFPTTDSSIALLFKVPAANTGKNGCRTMDGNSLQQWQQWRTAFLRQPTVTALGTPALASTLVDCAWLMQDEAVLAAIQQSLDKTKTPMRQPVIEKLAHPPARVLVTGAQRHDWAKQLEPVIAALPEPLNLFVLSPEVAQQTPPTPPLQPGESAEQTRAYLCRGVECSSAIGDLSYLLETLQDG